MTKADWKELVDQYIHGEERTAESEELAVYLREKSFFWRFGACCFGQRLAE